MCGKGEFAPSTQGRAQAVERVVRRAARKDSNHNEIAEYLIGLGYSVLDTSRLGSGFPDLLVGRPGFACLVEIKNGKGKLTEAQEDLRKLWRGPYVVARTPEEAAQLLLKAKYG